MISFNRSSCKSGAFKICNARFFIRTIKFIVCIIAIGLPTIEVIPNQDGFCADLSITTEDSKQNEDLIHASDISQNVTRRKELSFDQMHINLIKNNIIKGSNLSQIKIMSSKNVPFDTAQEITNLIFLSKLYSSFLLHDSSLLLIKMAHGLAIAYSNKMLKYATDVEIVDKLIKTGHVDSAYQKSTKIYKQALIDNDSLFIALSGIALGKSSESIGFPIIAIEFLDESRAYFSRTGDESNLAIAWEELGAIYFRMGQFEKAKTFLDKIHNLARSENDILLLLKTHFLKGDFYNAQNNTSRAISHFKSAMDIADELENLAFKFKIALKLAEFSTDSYDKKYIIEAEQVINQMNFNKLNAGFLVELGDKGMRMKDFERALSYYKEAATMNQYFSDEIELAKSYLKIAEAKLEMQHPKDALGFLDSVLLTNESSLAPRLLLRYYQLSALSYFSLGDNKNAHEMQKKYAVLKDSLVSVNFKKLEANLDLLHNISERKSGLYKLNAEGKVFKQNKRLFRSQRAYLIALLVASLLIILFIVFYIRFKNQRKFKVLNDEKKLLLIEKEISKRKIELNTAKKELNRNELAFQSDQLNNYINYQMKSNELLNEAHALIDNLEHRMNELTNDQLKEEIFKIAQKFQVDEYEWNNFFRIFNEINSNFLAIFQKKYNDLTSGEIRLCILIWMNLTNSEIGSLLNMSVDSVKNAKHRLKKKLKLDQKEDLYLAIVKVNN